MIDHLERLWVAKRMTEQNRKKLADFVRQPNYDLSQSGLLLPSEVLPYMLIPQRLLALPEITDPRSIVVEPRRSTKHTLEATVVDQNRSANTGRILSLQLDHQPGTKYLSLVSQQYYYSGDEEFRGKGVAKSYYKQLRDAAKLLGYRTIIGENNETNTKFFRNTLHRECMSYVLPEQRYWIDESAGRYKHHDTAYYTSVDFLYPEDKNKFLIQEDPITWFVRALSRKIGIEFSPYFPPEDPPADNE